MKFRQLVDQATMQAIDAEATTRAGITALSLMEAAADCAAGLACSLVSGPSAKVLILAGPGNNGADGLAVGRLLVKAGYHPDLYSVVGRSGRTSELWQEQARRLASAGRAIFPFETSLKGSWDLIIDALAGVGQKGPLEGPVVQAVDWIKGWTEVAGQAQVLSLDLPSGLYDAWQDGQPAVRANHTMCFGLPKLCLYTARARHLAGQIVIADIGIPAGIAMPADAPELLLHEDLAALVPPVGPDSHKFDRGSR